VEKRDGKKMMIAAEVGAAAVGETVIRTKAEEVQPAAGTAAPGETVLLRRTDEAVRVVGEVAVPGEEGLVRCLVRK
jgi:hypothetical protein